MDIKKRPKKFLYTLLLISFTATAQNKNINNFTVQQAVEYAKKNNTQVKNALLNVKIQEQTNRGITAAAYPNITSSVGTTYFMDIPTSLIPAEAFGGTKGDYIPVRFGTKYNTTASVQLQQLLFDGQVFVGLQARKASMEWKQHETEITEEAIKVNVYKIYYQLVVAKSQVELLDANIARLDKLYHDVNEMYKNGFVEKLDVDKLDVNLINLKTEKEKVNNSIAVGYIALKTLIGMSVKDSLILTDKISDSEIKSFALIDSVNYTDRKDYQYWQSIKSLSEYQVKRYKLSYLPTVSANASYQKQALRNKYTFFEKGDWFNTSYVGLNIAVPIFTGFSRDAKVKQSKLELQQVNNNIDNLRNNIDAETEQAKLKFTNAVVTIDNQKRNMLLAEKVYEQTKKKFEAGTGSNTEINTAQTELKTAQTNYISALYDAIIAKVDYLKAIGKL
ncbi:MAG: TolC family protein [Bacteroidetes bacterium]|nr:TolC family protein [Bacteroidota bacterium]